MILLAETLTTETGVSVGLLLSIAGLVGGGLITGIVSRVLHNVSIKHLRADVEELTTCLQDRTKRLQELETKERVREAIKEDREAQAKLIATAIIEAQARSPHAPTADAARSGTRPYSRPGR